MNNEINNEEFIKYYSWLKNFNKNNNHNHCQYGGTKPKLDFSSLKKKDFIDSNSLINAINKLSFNNTTVEKVLKKIVLDNFVNKIKGLIYFVYKINQIKNNDTAENKIQLFDKTDVINKLYVNLLNNIFMYLIPKFDKLSDSDLNNIFNKLQNIQPNFNIKHLSNEDKNSIINEKFISNSSYDLLIKLYNTTSKPIIATSTITKFPVVSFDEFIEVFKNETTYSSDTVYIEFINKADTNDKELYYNPALYFPFFTELKDLKDNSAITTALFTIDFFKKLLTQILNVDFNIINTKNIVNNIKNNISKIVSNDLDTAAMDFLNTQLQSIVPKSLPPPPLPISTITSTSASVPVPVPPKPIIELEKPNKIYKDIIDKITDLNTNTIIKRFTDKDTNIIDNKYLSLLVNNEIKFTNTDINTIIPDDLKSTTTTSTTNFISQRGGLSGGSGSVTYDFDYILNDTTEYILTITDIFIIDKYWDFYKSIVLDRGTYVVSNLDNFQDFKNNWINNIREYHNYISIDNIIHFDELVLNKLKNIKKNTTGELIGYNKLKEVLKNIYEELNKLNDENVIKDKIFSNIEGYNKDGDANPGTFGELENEYNFYILNDIGYKKNIFNDTNTIFLENRLVISDNFETLLFLKNDSDDNLYGTILLKKSHIQFSYDFTKVYLFYNNDNDDSTVDDYDVSITNICLEIVFDEKSSKFKNAYVFGLNRNNLNEYIRDEDNTKVPRYGYKIDLINEDDLQLKKYENYENTRFLLLNNEIYELDKYLYETYKSMLLIDTFIFNNEYKYDNGSRTINTSTIPTLKSSYIDTVHIIKQDAGVNFASIAAHYNEIPIKSYFGYFWNFKDIFNYKKRDIDLSQLYYINNDDDNTYIKTNNDKIYINKSKEKIICLFTNAEDEFIYKNKYEDELFDINRRIYNNKFAINKFQIEFNKDSDKFIYEFPKVSNYQILNKLECFETLTRSNRYDIRIYSGILDVEPDDFKEDSDFKDKIQKTYVDNSLGGSNKNLRYFQPESVIVKVESVDDIFINGDLCIKIKIYDNETTTELGTIYFNNNDKSYDDTNPLYFFTESNIILFKSEEPSDENYYICQKSEFINENKSSTKRKFYINEDMKDGFGIMEEINHLNKKEYKLETKDTTNNINIIPINNYKKIDYYQYSLDNRIIVRAINNADELTSPKCSQIFYINDNIINNYYSFYFESINNYDNINDNQDKIIIIFDFEQNQFKKTQIKSITEKETNLSEIIIYINDNEKEKDYAKLTVKLNDKNEILYITEYNNVLETTDEINKDSPKSFEVSKPTSTPKPKPFFRPSEKDAFDKIETEDKKFKEYKKLDVNTIDPTVDIDDNIEIDGYSQNMSKLKNFLYNTRSKFKEMEENIIKKDEERELLERRTKEELENMEAQYMQKKAELVEGFEKDLENENVDYEELSKRVEALLVWLDENKINKLSENQLGGQLKKDSIELLTKFINNNKVKVSKKNLNKLLGIIYKKR